MTIDPAKDIQSGGRSCLAHGIAQFSGSENRVDTDIPGLTLHRWETPTEPTSYMLAPSVCLIGQGRKRLFLGEDAYIYDANSFLITSVDLPVVSQILEATREEPYLGLTLELDLKLIAMYTTVFRPKAILFIMGLVTILVFILCITGYAWIPAFPST